MKKFLNDIRSAENPISGNRKIINTIAILLLGIALGTFSKFLDFRQAELPSVLSIRQITRLPKKVSPPDRGGES